MRKKRARLRVICFLMCFLLIFSQAPLTGYAQSTDGGTPGDSVGDYVYEGSGGGGDDLPPGGGEDGPAPEPPGEGTGEEGEDLPPGSSENGPPPDMDGETPGDSVADDVYEETDALGALPQFTMFLMSGASSAQDWYDEYSAIGAFPVSSVQELVYVAELVNEGITTFEEEIVYLTGDVDLGGAGDWTPIGFSDANSFQGTFDGAGYAVKNMTVNRPSNNYAGLFGYVKDAVIRNLGIDGGTVTGRSYIAGVAGCAAGATTGATTIENCYNTAAISAGTGGRAGGIAGWASGNVSIVRSWNAGSVATSDTSSNIGGILGGPTGNGVSVSDCYNTGMISNELQACIGGIVGGHVESLASVTISNCYNVPAITNPIKGTNITSTPDNCYYLVGDSGTETDSAKYAAAFSNGELAWLLNTAGGTAENRAVWGHGEIVSAALDRGPVLANEAHGPICKLTLTQEETPGSPGVLTGVGDTYVAAGSQVELTVQGLSRYTLEIISQVPVDLIIEGNQFTMPDRDVVIECRVIPDAQGWYDDYLSATEFVIQSGAELGYLAELVNDGTDSFHGKTISLTGDIDLAGVDNWTPIGDSAEHSFQGTFDGAGHLIKNLAVNRTDANYAGLFGYVDNAGIKNLGIAGGTVTGVNYAGGVTGYAAGTTTIENCYNTAAITATTGDNSGGIAGGMAPGSGAANCYNLPPLYNPIRGGADGALSNCYYLIGDGEDETVTGTVYAKKAASFNSGAVSWLLNMGGAAEHSGIWGLGEIIFEGSEFTAPVFAGASQAVYRITLEKQGDGPGSAYVENRYAVPGTRVELKINQPGGDSYYDLQVEETSPPDLEIFSVIDGGGYFNMPESNVQIDYRLVQGSDGQSWYLDNQDANEFFIGAARDLVYLAQLVNGEVLVPGFDKVNFSGKTITLTRSLDLWGLDNWTPIGLSGTNSFQGTFDGAGHTVGNLTVNMEAGTSSNEKNAGLFGYLEDAVIKDLTISEGAVTGGIYVRAGGVAGFAKGETTIENCVNNASVALAGTLAAATGYAGGIIGAAQDEITIRNCGNNAPVTVDAPQARAGGIAGRISSTPEDKATITGCANAAAVTATTNGGSGYSGGIVANMDSVTVTDCSNTGAVSSTNYSGGIAGYSTTSTITGSHNAGPVTGNDAGGIAGNLRTSSINQSRNTGGVSGTGAAGGIVGYFSLSDPGDKITDCYNIGSITGTNYTGGIAGRGTNDTKIFNAYNLPGMTKPLIGDNNNTPGRLGNCYYLTGDGGPETAANQGIGKEAAFFNNGEASWLLNTAGGTAANGSVWGLGEMTADWNAELNKAPVFSDETHRPVYGVALVNLAPIGSAGRLVCDGSAYAPAGTAMTLRVELNDGEGQEDCTLEIVGHTPDRPDMFIDENNQFIMPAKDVTIEYTLSPAPRAWYDQNPDADNFTIGTAAELAYLAELVDHGIDDFSGKTIALEGDITLPGADFWMPIGDSPAYSFRGTFDGAGHLIKNLAVNRPEADYAGLFGCVHNAVVKNLGIAGGTVHSNNYAGGIAGYAAGTTEIRHCYSTAYVTANGTQAGGIVGAAEQPVGSVVVNSYSLVDDADPETDSAKHAAAFNSGAVSWLLNMGGTAEHSGLWGLGEMTADWNPGLAKAPVPCDEGHPAIYKVILTNLEPVGAPGTVVCAPGEYMTPGGAVTLQIEFNEGQKGYIINAESIVPASVTINSDNQFTMPASNVQIDYRLAEGSDGKSWYLDNPYAESFTVGAAADLVYLAKLVNGEIAGAPVNFSGRTITLAGDVDLTGADWTPIGDSEAHSFQGTFDGGGHTITNLTVNRPDNDYAGLFGYINSGVIKDLAIGGGTVTGKDFVGGIAGHAVYTTISNCSNAAAVTGANINTGGIVGSTNNITTITDCSNKGTVTGTGNNTGGILGLASSTITFTNCSNEGAVTGNQYTGGIAGYTANIATFTNCSNEGDITGNSTYAGGIVGQAYVQTTAANCSNAGDVTGNYTYRGGIAGRIDGNLTGCSNTGAIAGASYLGGIAGYKQSEGFIEQCYNTGSVTGSAASNVRTGGIVGYLQNAAISVSDCYNAGAVSGGTAASLGGIVGGSQSNVVISHCYNLHNMTNPIRGTTAGALSNCYYLIDDAGTETATGTEDKKKEAAFGSGEVAWLLNMRGTAEHSGVWSLGETTFDGGEFTAPVFVDAARPGIYKVVELKNRDFVNEADAPGRVVCTPSAYAAAGSTVALTLELNPGEDYILQVESVSPSGVVIDENNQFTMPPGNVSIEYTLVKDALPGQTFTVIFDYQDGATPNLPVAVTYPDPLPEPAEPEWEGHGFLGWYQLNTDLPYPFGQPVRSDFTLYARWGSQYEAVFHWNDETSHVTTAPAVTIGAPLPDPSSDPSIEPNPPVKEYMRVYWHLDSACTGPAWDFAATRISEAMLTDMGGGVKKLLLYGSWRENIADKSWFNPLAEEFALETREQLFGFAQLVNEGNVFAGQTVRLSNDIDLRQTGWTPAGTVTAPFNGAFDGNSFTISGLSINNPGADYQGLFGAVGDSAVIKNLTVAGEVTGRAYVAGIAALMKGGLIDGVTNEVKVTAKAASGVSANGAAGIAGRQEGGVIVNCINQGEITVHSDTPQAASPQRAGGIAGYSAGLIDSCVNNGAVSLSVSINNSIVGGIAAHSSGAVVRNSLNTGSITNNSNSGSSAQSAIGGIIGLAEGGEIGIDKNGSRVEACLNYGALAGKAEYGGGIVGDARTKTVITRCGNEGDINLEISFPGGIAGRIYQGDTRFKTTVTDNYNRGGITCTSTSAGFNGGGIAGIVNGADATLPKDGVYLTVSYNYNRGDINYTGGSSTARLGGILGQCAISGQSAETVIFSGNYSAAELKTAGVASPLIGALIGTASGKLTGYSNFYNGELCPKSVGNSPSSVTAEAMTTAEMQDAGFAAALGSSYVPDPGGINGSYPVLYWEAPAEEGDWTVTFDFNDGTGGKVTQKVPAGGLAVPAAPLRTGYTLTGWYLERYATEEPFDFDTPVAGDLTLYAKWDFATYTVTYDRNDGSAGEDRIFLTQQYTYTATTVPRTERPTAEPLLEDFEFYDWYTGRELPGGGVQLDDEPFVFGGEVTGSFTLYARWNGVIPDYAWYAGPTGPYEIGTIEQLAGLARLVNGTGPDHNKVNFEDQTITLTNNLDLDGIVWTPIGQAAGTPFAGTFDGAGHAVRNLTVNPGGGYRGLFGYVDRDGTLKNLTVEGGSVAGGSSYGAGALAGHLDGKIEDCANEGAAVTGVDAGGIAGSTGTDAGISGCANTAPVSGSFAGGIAGWFTGEELRRCKNSGAVTGSSAAGGIAGRSAGAGSNDKAVLEYNVNRGSVQGSQGAANVGGIVGITRYTEVGYCSNLGPVTVKAGGFGGGLAGTLDYNSPLYSSFSVGLVTGGGTTGAAVAQRGNNNFTGNTLTNVYVLDGDLLDKGWVKPATAEALGNGSLAYGMNKDLAGKWHPAWSQGPDGYPVPAAADGGNAVFRVSLQPLQPGFDHGTAVLDKAYSNAGASVTVTAEPEEGYAVVLVAAGKENGGKAEVTHTPDSADYVFTMPVTDVGVTVRFDLIPVPLDQEFTVTFDGKGGAWDGDVGFVAVPVQALEKVSPPAAPVKDGYAFQGWCTDEALNTPYDFDTLVVRNFTLYAKWKAVGNVYVTFNLNGVPGTAPPVQEVAVGGLVTEPDAPAGDGEHYFAGWARDRDGKFPWNFGADRAGNQDFTLYARWRDFPGGAGTSPFDAIELAADDGSLERLADLVRQGDDFAGKYFKLTSDVTIDAPIGDAVVDEKNLTITLRAPFNGIFDGDGHTVTLDISNGSSSISQSLFACLGAGAEVRNLNVEGTVAGRYLVGGIAGYNQGLIEDCFSSATVSGVANVGGIAGYNYNGTITGCENTGPVEGSGVFLKHSEGSNVYFYSNTGGIVGYTSGTGAVLENCTNSGAVEGAYAHVGGIAGVTVNNITGCHNSGTVTGLDDRKSETTLSYIGGIAGVRSDGLIVGCTNEGEVSAPLWSYVGGITGSGPANRCDNEGAVTGNYLVGGIAGALTGGVIQDCNNSGDVSATKEHAGGIAGQTSSDSIVQQCSNSGVVTGANYTGGIAGQTSNNSIVQQCSNSGAVTGTNYTGGIAGWTSTNSIVQQCGNSGAVTGADYAGGIVGYARSNVRYSYNLAPITATGGNAGGIAGSVESSNESVTIFITSCFSYEVDENGSPSAPSISALVGNGGQSLQILRSFYCSGPESGQENMMFGFSVMSAAADPNQAKTPAQFAGGEVAYLLDNGGQARDGIWGQKLGQDQYPHFADAQHPLIYLARAEQSEGGAVTVNGRNTHYAEQGSTVSISAQADADYEFESLTVNGVDYSTSSRSIVIQQADIVASATFVKKLEEPIDEDEDDDDNNDPGKGGENGDGEGPGDGEGIGDGSGSGEGDGSGVGSGSGEGGGIGVGEGTGGNVVDGAGSSGVEGTIRVLTPAIEQQSSNEVGTAEQTDVSPEQNEEPSSGRDAGGGGREGEGSQPPEMPEKPAWFRIDNVMETIRQNPFLTTVIIILTAGILLFTAGRRYWNYRKSIK